MKKIITILLLSGLFSISSFAQVANYLFSQSTGTFDTLANGKIIGSVTTAAGTYFTDSTVTAGSVTVTTGIGLPIGFTFKYNGIFFDVFGVNANGWISFGQSALAPSSVNMNTSQTSTPISATSTAPADLQNRVSPFGRNIMAQATSKLSYGTIGIAPSRTLVVEWKNYRRSTGGGVVDTFSFQVRLHETTNVVEFVYGKMKTSSTNSTVQVGLRGQANTDYNNRTSLADWTATSAGNNNAATMAITTTVFPVQGLTYIWTPPVYYQYDAGIIDINSPNTPVNPGINNVSVTIKNFGTDSLKNASIQWSVNGTAQTSYAYTNLGLPQNATDSPITIGAFDFAIQGSYIIKVWTSLPNGMADGNNTNDTILKTVFVQGYASIPFYEGFDSTWVNKSGNHDVPSLYWINTPPTGNNSWRRDDDGASASWGNINTGVYTPAGANSTIHSARFHTGGSTAGAIGSLDLYLDFTPVGYKVLKFWHINTAGTDSLTVSISLDNGTIFNVLQKFAAAANWTERQIALGSSVDSNVVLRFSAIANQNGNTDPGIDGVEIFMLPQIDAGLASIDAPLSIVSGNSPVAVTIKNFGLDSLSSASIGWSVNGVSQTPFAFTSSPGIATNATHGPDTIGNYNFNVAGFYTIKAWTSLPNGNSDGNNSNDTLMKNVFVQSYANLPFAEGFDSLWINKNNTRDVPSLYWVNNPSTGNTSWRRDDDGASASWTNVNTGVYTPAGANTSVHSARFHSFAPTGTIGTFDVYLNFNTIGTKILKFWHINTQGADSLFVYISTDAGSTFNVLQKFNVATAWTNRQIPLGTSIDSNVIIRFVGLASNGQTDIGLDNLEVSILPPNDAGIVSIDLPGSVAIGNSPVALTIKNFGADSLKTATINWSVNSALQTTFAYSDTTGIAYNSTDGPITIGNYNFINGFYTIKAWTSDPNAGIDGDNTNDTISKIVYAQTFASIPFTEGFDSVWVDKNNTHDAPSLYWVNNPATGNNSWRRDDDGASASWSNVNTGAYTPAGANSSIHSARFHTLATAGSLGTLDLYLNLSTVGKKILKFWHINTAGTDSLYVYLSTDAGNTFNVLQGYNVSTVWTKKQILLGSLVDSNVVVRFIAKANGGQSDIGMDDIEISILPANDAGLISIDSPGAIVTGNSPVAVTIKNYGADSLTSANIDWSVNGVAQTTYAFTSSPGIATYASNGPVTIGNYNFSTSGYYTIKAWTSIPNINIDADATNDTVVKTIYAQMYATIPFMEGFDSTWVSKYDTNDVPTAYWNNTPAFGNNSWRRDDDTISGNWTQGTNGAYTPIGADGSIHSARFHSWWAANNANGILDLFIDLSPAGNKLLDFWYINTSGNDSLSVYLSTDGGTSFSFIQKITVAATWTKNIITIGTAQSSNGIIRFRAVSDNGQTDIGLDQVQVYLSPAEDMTALNWVSPVSGCGLTNAEHVTVKVINTGSSVKTNIPVKYSINGGNTFIGPETIAGPLNPGDTATYNFTATSDFSVPGSYNCLFVVQYPGDLFTLNDTAYINISSIGTIAGNPFNDNLESGNNYYILTNNTNSAVALTAGVGNFGTYGFDMTGGAQGTWPNSTSASTTPQQAFSYTDHVARIKPCSVDATAFTTNQLFLKLDLQQTHSTNSGFKYNYFMVVVNGTDTISDFNGTKFFNPQTQSSDPFTTRYFNLATYAGQIFDIEFVSSCKYNVPAQSLYDHVYLDNIALYIPPVMNDLGPDTSICQGSSITFDAGPGTGYSYIWTEQPAGTVLGNSQTLTATTSGTYQVVVTNSLGYSAIDDITLTVVPAPVVDAGLDTTITYLAAANLHSMITGSGNYTYAWSPADSLVDATVQNPVTVPLHTSNMFILYVTDNNTGCVGSDTVIVFVTGGTLTVSAFAAPDTICVGEQVVVQALPSGGTGTYTYNWTSTPAGFTASTITASDYPMNNIMYNVTVSDGVNTANATVNVIVYQLPAVNLGNDTTLCTVSTLILNAGTGSTYLWSNGATTQNIIVDSTYANAGLAKVWVAVTNQNGCIKSDTINITFVTCPGIDEYSNDVTLALYPNPTNGMTNILVNGLNTEADLAIYNLQGKMVYSGSIAGNGLTTLDLSALSKGIYMVRIRNEHNNLISKLIKQ